jgi:plasmid maintenance system antidote protein VapI
MTTSTNNDEFDQFVSPAMAARIIGISKQSVANLIRRNYFKIKTVAGRVLLLRTEVEALVTRPKGRPAKGSTAKKAAKPAEALNKNLARDYVSQADAARIRGVSQQAIANLIRRGRLAAVSIAGRTLVVRSEAEAFVAKPKLGRPPKNPTIRKADSRRKSKE